MTPYERSEKLLNRISEWDFNRMNEGAMRAELESEIRAAVEQERSEILRAERESIIATLGRERAIFTLPGNFREAEVYRRCISIIEDRSLK